VTRQLAAFLVIGAAAAATHWGAVLLLVEGGGVSPLRANVAGFGLAFLLSYGGHRRWTFAAMAPPHRVALPRFLLVALSGLLLNQALFALLLARTALPYPLALLLVLLAVAVLTFLLARCWAFATRPV
jgi:putative flippase GtrA